MDLPAVYIIVIAFFLVYTQDEIPRNFRILRIHEVSCPILVRFRSRS